MKLTLREWRNAKEVSQQEMADLCGIHVNTYARWESHPEDIPIGKAHAISLRLNVPIDDIFFVENPTKCGVEEG